MPNTIRHKRGTTTPAAGSLVVGELAINTATGAVFTKTDAGSVVSVGGSGSSVVQAWVNFNGVPLSGTYSRTGTLVTVTMTAHGMTTGQRANLDFTSGTATDGTYTVTVTGANTFTVTDTVSGTTSGNVTRNAFIRASYNVSSITDNGVGNYTVNFTTAMTDANYAVSGYADAVSSKVSLYGPGSGTIASASSVQVGVSTAGGTTALVDAPQIHVAIFR